MKKAPKKQRQMRILQLVGERNIETQSDLVDALQSLGMEVTQATVSRDIKELGIVKVMTGEGTQKYVTLTHSGEATSGRMKRVFADAVMSIDNSDSLVVVKTLPGMAQGAASAVDSMYLEEVLGSLAGDDTIFIATYGPESAERLLRKLQEIAKISYKEDEERS